MLADHAVRWDRKPVLRTVYGDFYDRLATQCLPGVTVELGGGIGNLKRRMSGVVSTDLQSGPFIDCVVDAHLPFAAGAVSNLIMIDVLHHLEFSSDVFPRCDARAGFRRPSSDGRARDHMA